MADLRRNDPARRGDPRDRRPVRPLPFARNGIPSGRPYVYRGRGGDTLTPWHAWLNGWTVATVAELTAWERLDVCEQVDGPGWGDWRETCDQDMP
jgi:hypothetical protein